MLSLEATLDRVERLSQSGAAADVRALVRLLGSEDWQTRRAAAEGISSLVLTRAEGLNTDELFRELITAVSDKTDAGRRAAAIAALEGIGAPALPALAQSLRDSEASSAIALAGLIGQVGGEEAVTLLEPLAESRDTNIATSAISALGRTRHPAATQLLLRALEREDEWLRFAAVGALGELGDARAVPTLEKLLKEPLMEEAAATALEEIASIESVTALAGNLRDEDGRFRPRVLAALVSLSEDERSLPSAVQERLRYLAEHLFRQSADDATFGDLLRLTATLDPQLKRASITALGWMGDDRAVPVIAEALADPAFIKTARRALRNLSGNVHALTRMLEMEADLIPPLEIATAISGAKSYQAIEAAARLSLEAADAETMEAALAVLAAGRDQLRKAHAELLDRERALKLAESLSDLLSMAEGRALVEIAETLGLLASALPFALMERIADTLSQVSTDDHLLARLAFLDNADPLRAVEEAARAERHKSARVRLSAIEILSWRSRPRDNASLALHLTDEATGVRRAAMRAMRRGAPTPEANRAIHAALADEDIWVRAEAIATLGALFGADSEARARLREALGEPHPLVRVAASEALTEHADSKDWRALAQTVRRDSQPEARRAATLAFTRCPQPRTTLSVARAALKDEAWPVRRAGVQVLSTCLEASAHKLLLEVVSDEDEHETVRGAALRAFAPLDAPRAVSLSCDLISTGDAALIEDAYAALKSLERTHAELMEETAHTCAPRAASIIKAVMSDK
ncbi:MAG: HEAT repeat domain-containing protein [Pyrinomonadaceae bacterium]|nr:HEAT repeat domain-containing protein [Pyrinomonadaceae bacterium]